MAIALSSSRCFDAVSNALQAVRHGNTSGAAIILHSVKSDAKLMRNGLQKYHQRLQSAEKKYENKAEQLTREINDLYQEEQKLRREERKLEETIAQLRLQNERNVENRNKAERRYRQARAEEQKAREKHELHETLYWVPIVNIFAAIVEAVEENAEKAREARADMERYQRHINDENDDIRATNSQISTKKERVQEIQRKAASLKKQRDYCHNELTTVKSISVFVLDASKVSSEIVNLTEEATVKTENLERLMRLASKENTLKVLKSGGMKTKVGSFKECWEEIADMVQSNSLLSLDEELYLE